MQVSVRSSNLRGRGWKSAGLAAGSESVEQLHEPGRVQYDRAIDRAAGIGGGCPADWVDGAQQSGAQRTRVGAERAAAREGPRGGGAGGAATGEAGASAEVLTRAVHWGAAVLQLGRSVAELNNIRARYHGRSVAQPLAQQVDLQVARVLVLCDGHYRYSVSMLQRFDVTGARKDQHREDHKDAFLEPGASPARPSSALCPSSARARCA